MWINGRFFEDQFVEMIVFEKMDGENTSFYRDSFHSRSLDSNYHESRSFAKALWGSVRWMIPEGRRVICENVYAEHSVRYDNLPTFVFGIAVIDCLNSKGNLDPNGEPTFLCWDETEKILNDLGIMTVPILYRGPSDFNKVKNIFNALDFNYHEGIVVRNSNSFLENDFQKNVGKAVRPHHVQTSENWMTHWSPNTLK